MNDVKQLAFTVFCCSIACCITEQITPESFKKQMRCILGITLMICVFAPIKDILDVDLNFDEYYSEQQNNEINIDNLLLKQFELRLSEIIRDKLSLSGIFADDIRIEINISEQELSIKSVTVMLYDQDGDKIQKVKSLLREFLEMDVTVICTGGEN